MSTNIQLRVAMHPEPKQLLGRWNKGKDRYAEQQFRTIQEQLRILTEDLRQAAPGGGEFARKHAFRTFRKGSGTEGRIYIPKPLGTWIRFGTKPHLIVPRNAKALKFEIGGTIVFAKVVHHPGTAPNPYFENTVEKWKPKAIAAMRKMSKQFLIEVFK